MQRSRIDIWCQDLGITGDTRKLLILFGDKGEMTREEMVDCLFADDPEGGPLAADRRVRSLVCSLRKLLAGRAEIPRTSVYKFKLLGVHDEEP